MGMGHISSACLQTDRIIEKCAGKAKYPARMYLNGERVSERAGTVEKALYL
ncbi:hypothetical protein [Oceanimonas marisflavi]|uniref:hypothetical protein n=1 Tax=Oceanimonas marisflavi TaxID=2059724 RepID=UPI001300BDBF|nr:hypothetical protein [Oceanimonas marisflavi]